LTFPPLGYAPFSPDTCRRCPHRRPACPPLFLCPRRPTGRPGRRPPWTCTSWCGPGAAARSACRWWLTFPRSGTERIRSDRIGSEHGTRISGTRKSKSRSGRPRTRCDYSLLAALHQHLAIKQTEGSLAR